MNKKIPVRHLTGLVPQSLSAEQFKIRRVEDIVEKTGLIHNLHRHDFYFLLVLSNGSGEHEIDFELFPVKDSSIFFLRPGQVHQLSLHFGSTGYLLEFNAAFFHLSNNLSTQRLSRASYKNCCLIEQRRFDKLCLLLELVIEESTHKEAGFNDTIRLALEIFFIEFLRQGSDQKRLPTASIYAHERFEELISLLDENIHIHKQTAAYAEMMNLSAYQLGEISKLAVGKTVAELINERILLEAKRHLIATSAQVKEIAELLGYEDHSYFIRFFKKHIGQSPEAFRQNSR